MSRFFHTGNGLECTTRTHHDLPGLTAADWVTDIILVDEEPSAPDGRWSELLAEAPAHAPFSGPDSMMAFLDDLETL